MQEQLQTGRAASRLEALRYSRLETCATNNEARVGNLHSGVARPQTLAYTARVPEPENPGLERVRYELRADGVKHDTPSAQRSGVHSRGYLPHVKREGANYFVTFRLADSLPKEVLLRYEAEKAERLRALYDAKRLGRPASDNEESINRDYLRKVEQYLDTGAGACHLRRPDIAELVAGAVKFFHEQRYVLRE